MYLCGFEPFVFSLNFFYLLIKFLFFWSSQEALNGLHDPGNLCKMDVISFSSSLNNVELASLKYLSM